MPTPIYELRKPALECAKLTERETGKPHYVVRCFPDVYEVTDRMPLLGTWWTSDGIRHG